MTSDEPGAGDPEQVIHRVKHGLAVEAEHRALRDPAFQGDPKDAPLIPDGGTTTGRGFEIAWQRGPLVVDGDRVEANGAFVEHVILAAKDRLEYFQRTKFASQFNDRAIAYLQAAIGELQARRQQREQRGVEGTHTQ